MSRALVILASHAERQRVANWAMKAPVNTRVEFKAPKRSLPQNDRMWSMLTEVAQQLPWHGIKLAADDWKLIFLDALKREVRMVPNLDGNGFVNLGRSSSRSRQGRDVRPDGVDRRVRCSARRAVPRASGGEGSMRVLVTGGRDYPSRVRVFQVLDKLHAEAGITAIIEGGHWNGADKLAREWAKANGLEPETYAANWIELGNAAGPIRNEEMVRESRPDVCVGFPTPGEKNKGTRGCMKLARAAGVEVVEIAT